MADDPVTNNGRPGTPPPKVGFVLTGFVVLCVLLFVVLPALLGVAVNIFKLVE